MTAYGPRSSAKGPVETERVLSETRRVFRRSGSVPCRGHSPALRSILCPTGSGAECASCGCTPHRPSPRRLPWKRLSPFQSHLHPRRTLQSRPPKMWNRPAKQSKHLSRLMRRLSTLSSPSHLGSGMILVSRQPIEVLASPSSSAPALYGFPAGRPFRVIGRDGGFAHIQDLKSSASGWIDEAALTPPPSAPAVSAPSQPKPSAVSRKPANPSADPKPKATKNDSGVTADSEAATQPDRRRPGLFGRGGVFGGIFRNSN